MNAELRQIWNLEAIQKVPATYPAYGFEEDEVTPVFFENVPYQGKSTRAFAWYGFPEGASAENPAPGIVLVHGGGGTALADWCRNWIKMGYAVIAMDNCGGVPAWNVSAHYRAKWPRHEYSGPAGWGNIEKSLEPPEDQWVYHAIAAVVKSHSFLRSFDCIDTSSIGVTGVSWGGFLTCIAAAVDDRFAFAAPVYGCAFNYERGGLISKEIGMGKWSKMWDPSVFLPYAKIPFLWLNGTNDFAFSLDRMTRSSELATGPQYYCYRLRMRHSHGPVSEAPNEILTFANHFSKGTPNLVNIFETKVENNSLCVSFNDNTRKVVKAELLWTCDGEDVNWTKRFWNSKEIEGFNPSSGKVKASLPEKTYQAIINLITDDGLIVSSKLQTL